MAISGFMQLLENLVFVEFPHFFFFPIKLGLKPDGLDLLQKHVDLTSDVQTASLAAVYSFPNHEIEEDSRVKNWIERWVVYVLCTVEILNIGTDLF